jgi:hypothetical protein
MAALFFDIDGTVVHFHTNEWLPGVKERLCKLAEAGHQVIFVTMRGPQDEGTAWSVAATQALLEQLPFKYHLLTGVGQPRLLIDDGTPIAVQAKTDDPTSWLNRVI